MTSPTYEVGYGRPPVSGQFQKGQSGNLAGRPKGRRNVASTIAAAFAERVTVTVNGRRRSMSKLEAACVQVANLAASGDRHALKLGMRTALRDRGPCLGR
jgi:hypothetical protein